jgi:hypothetical protein
VSGAGDLHLAVTANTDFTSTAQFVVYGNVCCEASVDANLKSRRYLDSRENGARFRASAEGDVLSGDVKIRGDDYEFSLDRSTRYAQALTLADLAGTYSRTTTVFLGPISTYTVTIDANGVLTGSHTNGCVYNGAVTIPDPPRNLFKLSVELNNCPRSITGSGSMSGSYTGFGILARNAQVPSDPTKRANLFMHTLAGPTWLGLQTLEP